jgi:uncharacterized protein YdeI (YjbR/CyaY-like superfamily)
MPATKELPIRSFATPAAWEGWLAEHSGERDGLWLKLAKKGSGIVSVTYEEALDAALCYGWIDGQVKPLDEAYFLRKFTPRRPKSLWSRRNIDHVARLTAAGRMRPSGLAAVEAAQEDGRWEVAYDSPKNMEVPEDFLEALGKKKEALRFFESLSRTNVYAIAWRLKTAKTPETRTRRFDALMAMLDKEEKLH